MMSGPESRESRFDLGERESAPSRGDTALTQLTEAIRVEWEARNQGRPSAPQFGLTRLFGYAEARSASSSEDPANYMQNEKPHELPSHWVDQAGQSRALDNAFFEAKGYALTDLLAFDDAVFIEVAYRCLLKRRPDERGFADFLQALRSGSLDRIDVLGSLASSTEGRAKFVEVTGLKWLTIGRRARRVPYVGALIDWLHAIVHLSRLRRRQLAMEAQFEYRHREHAGRMDWLVDKQLTSIRNSIEAIGSSHEQLLSRSDSVSNSLRRIDVEMKIRLSQLESKASGYALKEGLSTAVTSILAELNDRKAAAELLSVKTDELIAQVADRIESVSNVVRRLDESGLTVRLDHVESAIRRDDERLDLLDHAHTIVAARFEAMTRDAGATSGRLELVESAVRRDDQRLHSLDQAHAGFAVRSEAMAGDLAATAARLEHVEHAIRLDDRRLDVLDQANAFGAERFDRFTTQFDGRLAPIEESHARENFSAEESRSLESFYEGLEARFRGQRADIILRFEPYLPFIRDSGWGTPDAPVLDLACGRGEWLELLKSNNLHAYGIDSSRVMVDHCRAVGVAAEQADVLAYLEATRDEAFGVISAMHIVEHLSFELLVRLIREIRRTLKPGGLLIFETPNPENLFVAAYTFRMDPTHRTPLPPPMLEYLVHSQGFEQPIVLRLNAGAYGNPFAAVRNDEVNLAELPGSTVLGTLRSITMQHFYSAPDFAVIARKPAARQDA